MHFMLINFLDMGVSSSVEAVPYNRKGKGKVQGKFAFPTAN
jgi:hypothetical protein